MTWAVACSVSDVKEHVGWLALEVRNLVVSINKPLADIAISCQAIADSGQLFRKMCLAKCSLHMSINMPQAVTGRMLHRNAMSP